jgi:hypothetical protein
MGTRLVSQTELRDQIVHDLLKSNANLFSDVCLEPFTVRNVSFEEVSELMNAAKQGILSHLAVKEIADVNENDLRVFFEGIQLFEVEYRTLYRISGITCISSYDGARIYLDKKIVDTQVNEQGEVCLWLRQLLEYQLMNCLSCWGKFDPYLLSSWCNRNLRSFNHPDTVLGAGHFYEERVYQKIIFPPSPCQINDLHQLFRE